jgi:outer membrane lipoprotein-sorting protein
MRQTILLIPFLLFLPLAAGSCGPCSGMRALPKEFVRLIPVIGSRGAFTAVVLEKTKTRSGDFLNLRTRWYYKKPGRLRTETIEGGDMPSRLVVSDGTRTWIQAGDVVTLGDKLPEGLWLFEGFQDENALKNFKDIRYLGRSRTDGLDVDEFELLVGQSDGPGSLRRLQVGFGVADGIPRKLAGLDAKGAVEMEFLLSEVKPQADLDDSLFMFMPPPGAAVQELRQK